MLLLSSLIVLLVLLAAAVGPAQGQEISTTGNSAIMTCTGGEDGAVIWYKKEQKEGQQTNLTYNAQADQGTGVVEGEYSCEYKDEHDNKIKYMFYLKIKVCENCYELSGLKAWLVILADVLVTGGVILVVYACSTRNSDGTQKKASNPRSVNPPRPPNPDYEALDPKMRSSNALYAGLNK